MVSFNPYTPDFRNDPYPEYAALREQDPVHRSKTLQFWVLTRYEDCARVLRDEESFSSEARNATGLIAQLQAQAEAQAGPISRTVLSSDPPEHTRLRSLVNKAFTPRQVERLRPHIAEVTESLLDAASADEPFDVIRGLAQPLPIIIIAELLGVPPSEREQFKQWSTVMAGATSLMRTPEQNAAIKKTRAELREYFSGVIEERRAKPQEDLISALVQARDEGESLSDDELLAFCILLLVAGNETTTNLIGNGTLALARHPDQATILRDEPELMATAVEELLRFDGPVQATIRHALADTEVGKVHVAKGESTLVVLAAANRDPAVFEQPDKLDVRRKDNRHIAFGQGIHYCVGAPLARLEAQVAFGGLLRRYPKLALVDETVEYGGTFILRGLKSLMIAPADGA